MDDENLSLIVDKSLLAPDLSSIKEIGRAASGKQVLMGLISCVPFVGGLISSGIEAFLTYNDYEFFRKFGRFLYDLDELPEDKREKFCQDVTQHAQDASGNVLLNIIDQLDNINKVDIQSNLVKAKASGQISCPEFFRLSSLLARIPFTEIGSMEKYIQPHYSPDGETDVLLSVGAITLQTLDANGPCLYVLSDLGRRFLQFGLGRVVELSNSDGILYRNPWGEIA